MEKVTPGKVGAIKLALGTVRDLNYEYVANLDADVTFETHILPNRSSNILNPMRPSDWLAG